VAPQRLENSFLRSPLIDQIYVHGSSAFEFLVALVHPQVNAVDPHLSGGERKQASTQCSRVDVSFWKDRRLS
jgi:long-subunit acyl-CoA synthetase (AMP-forming)